MTQYVEITVGTSAPREIQVGTTPPPPNVEVTVDPSSYYVNLAKDWATKMSDKVANEDYSSKYYAENARVHAETAKMEVSTATGFKDLLKEDFDGYTESLNDTKNLVIEEINTTSTVAIGNINTVVTSSTEQINAVAKEQTELVASTANKALEDIETLSGKSTEELNTLGNTIKSDATDWIDVINATGKSYNMVTHRQLTNCITEIPQDIKLELNNGVLTLKAGSKVYVPNGFEADGTTKKFDEVTVESDIQYTYADGAIYCAYVFNGNRGGVNTLISNNSGATDTGTGWHLWYNTATNKINRYNGTTITEPNCSFPICIYSGTTSITSIDQVFNGFGYIGSTVFVLPNVKGLAPNGRNEDGSLRNVEFTTDKVYTRTETTVNEPCYIYYNVDNVWDTKLHLFGQTYCHNVKMLPSQLQDLGVYYVSDENKVYYEDLGQYARSVKLFGLNFTSGKITSFNPKLPFRAVDYSDKSVVSSWSFPSNEKYIELTLGATGTVYTAPANGWVKFYVQFSSSANTIQIRTATDAQYGYYLRGNSAGYLGATMPVKQGTRFLCEYVGTVSNSMLYFIYAESEV